MPCRVEIRHPGYAVPNILFSLPASDGNNRDRAHYSTILAASAVLTGEQSGTWLSQSSAGESRTQPDADGLISAGEYFLHVFQSDLSDNHPYAINANFRAWQFPRGPLPSLWQRATETATAVESNFTLDLLANESCRITDRRLACENAHIIPTSEKAWFARNEMDRYGRLSGRSGEAVADSSSNQMRLTRDAHWLWDNLHFSVVPREDRENEDQLAWFTHMLVEGEELYTRWHCRRLEPLLGRAPQYLFARFASDIFPKLHAFLQAGQPRYLRVRQLDGNVQARMYSAEECRQFTVGQGRNRSASPTKRARIQADSVVDELHSDESFDEYKIDTSLCDSDTSTITISTDSGISGIDPRHGHQGEPGKKRYAESERCERVNGDGSILSHGPYDSGNIQCVLASHLEENTRGRKRRR